MPFIIIKPVVDLHFVFLLSTTNLTGDGMKTIVCLSTASKRDDDEVMRMMKLVARVVVHRAYGAEGFSRRLQYKLHVKFGRLAVVRLLVCR